MSASCGRTLCHVNAGIFRKGEARRGNGGYEPVHVVNCIDLDTAAAYEHLFPQGIRVEVWQASSDDLRRQIEATGNGMRRNRIREEEKARAALTRVPAGMRPSMTARVALS